MSEGLPGTTRNNPGQNPTLATATTGHPKAKVFKLFYIALAFYCLPFLFLLFFTFARLFIDDADMKFWIIFLLLLMPCAVIGLLLSIWGLIRSFSVKNRSNKIAGFIGVSLGLVCLVAGIWVYH